MSFYVNSKNFALKTVAIFLIFLSNQTNISAQKKPNVIFILADDVGFDALSVNGNTSFHTPNIDSMAHHGINFTHCEGLPLCSPSRVMLLTGKYSFRNYSNWSFINDNEKTFGNVMQDAGYKTGFFGKLQLSLKTNSMANLGFDKYTVFEIAENSTPTTFRYKNPTLVDNDGAVPDSIVKNNYCDDILTNRILNFVDSNVNNPFFVFYSMSIAHQPYSPTPTDSAYANWPGRSNKSDTSFFPSMIARMDYEIGLIKDKLAQNGLDKNTIIIFAGDNGTPAQISYYVGSSSKVWGQKGRTLEGGTHVPLIAYWPSHIKGARINDDLIDFTDFLPTFAEASGNKDLATYGTIDGLSFYSRMLGIENASKQQLFFHYDAHPDYDSLERWVMNKTYKLYEGINGKPYLFYNIQRDKQEKKPLDDAKLTSEQKAIKARFKFLLDSMPTWPDAPVLKNQFVKNITATSATLGATIISAGSSSLIDRGSNLLVDTNYFCLLGYKRVRDAIVDTGTFSEDRSDLTSQTLYSYSLYAMNANAGHSTGYASGTFYTLSKPPLTQPSYFRTCGDTSLISLSWDKAKFPTTGATAGGYAIFYSTDSIKLVNNPDGLNPLEIAKNATLISLTAQPIKNITDSSFIITGLQKNIKYYFLLIPYTYDGKRSQTYNYFVNGALTATAIISSSLLNLSITNKNPFCFDAANGSIKASAFNGTQPYTFSLNNEIYTQDSIFKNLKAGSYLIKVKDNNGCIDSQRIALKNPQALKIYANAVSAICDDSIAFISASSIGGIKPYKYTLNNEAYTSDSIFTNLSSGTYTIKVKDINGCKDSAIANLKSPEKIKLNLSVTDADCNTKGEIIASAKNGIAPYLFSFNDGAFDTTSHFNNLTKGTYKVVVTDSDKCAAMANVLITINCNIGITISPNPSSTEFKITIENQASNNINIKVYDALGKLVYTAKSNQHGAYTFGRLLPKGAYLINIKVDNQNLKYKVIKS